jgi:hypothetical protein
MQGKQETRKEEIKTFLFADEEVKIAEYETLLQKSTQRL